MKHGNWRAILAALPLPMLALAASYGVYSFALLFVPLWVAITQAAAFELTYIGLSVLTGLDEHQRHRAARISIGAVIVSIIYNSLAGLFHRSPEVLTLIGLPGSIMLAALHGAPLAWVAYLVSDLLLHRQAETAVEATHENTAPVNIRAIQNGEPIDIATAKHDRTCKYCGDEGLSAAEVMSHGHERNKYGACGSMRKSVAAD